MVDFVGVIEPVFAWVQKWIEPVTILVTVFALVTRRLIPIVSRAFFRITSYPTIKARVYRFRKIKSLRRQYFEIKRLRGDASRLVAYVSYDIIVLVITLAAYIHFDTMFKIPGGVASKLVNAFSNMAFFVLILFVSYRVLDVLVGVMNPERRFLEIKTKLNALRNDS